MLTGLALDAEVQTDAVRFERKNYFYPDLPKGYQISQYVLPLTARGRLAVPVAAEDGEVTVGITRAHLEEDTARLLHGGRDHSLVDFNRAGIPLMEVVTEPDLRSPAQARAYGETLRDLLRFIGASDADMEAGSMRIEGNVSLRPAGSDLFGIKVEVKNLNSFRSLERALEFEVERMTEAHAAGVTVIQETRGWDENGGRTVPQRSRRRRTTTATSPSPTCLRCARTRRGSPSSGRRSPSCRPPAGRGTPPSSASRRTTPACSVRRSAWGTTSMRWSPPGSLPRRPRTG
jgi:aspartyl-tRNA(Asn)/glutamyl-tRNA(Gln) amidotransferase subunit B